MGKKETTEAEITANSASIGTRPRKAAAVAVAGGMGDALLPINIGVDMVSCSARPGAA